MYFRRRPPDRKPLAFGGSEDQFGGPGNILNIISNICWALVSEPGVSDFHISRFADFEISDFWKMSLNKSGFERSKKKDKRCSGETLDKTDGFEGHF